MPVSDVQIRQALEAGEIGISPFDPEMLQPASYDLKVGKYAATVGRPSSDPRFDLESEGSLLIPAYAPAVVFTKEELKLSRSYSGRFGLKSKLARRGLSASVGTQVDPGFQGPLSVTLLNQTPSSMVLNYDEDFLTLELERLAVPASRGYRGEYQGKKTFSAGDLEPVLGFQGNSLTDVVHGFNDIRNAVQGIAEMSKKLDTFMDQHRQEIRALQEFNQEVMSELRILVQHVVGEKPTSVVIRALSNEEARQEVLDLYRSSDSSLYYSDIAERLQMDLEQVLKVTTELEEEGLIGEVGDHG